jgi:proline utilization trans-activator
LLLCFLKIRLQPADVCLKALNSSANILRLIQLCIDSAQQQLNILNCLYEQSLLGRYPCHIKCICDSQIYTDSFLPFDLEAVFVSGVVILMAPIIDSSLLESLAPWLQKSYVILDDMISRGNIIASFRKSELERLDELLSQLQTDHPTQINDRMQRDHPNGMLSQLSAPTSPVNCPHELLNLNDGLTTAEIMAVAESIDTGDVDWVVQAVTENHIW